ncbi:hypothetical protein [Photobacterium sp. J15]|uniref:hypothetical protein n=1 Tax=Photobacterium sp. J15 TaxID=265901 RepID=UPI0007E49787|nr:hypothetical protein [Photobacterium sp. J15]
MKYFVLLTALFSFFVIAEDDALNKGTNTVSESIVDNDESELITEEQAEEMSLQRTDEYDVITKESYETLDKLIENKVKSKRAQFYSVEYDEDNSIGEYRATVTEYMHLDE